MSAEPILACKAANHPSSLVTLLLGAAGAGVVALGTAAPWTLGLLGAGLVFALSFKENEAVLLALTFLMPLDFTLAGDAPVRDIAVAIRLLAFIGYFLGRVSRGQFNINSLWRPAVSKAACIFLACLVVSMLFGTPGETHTEIRGIYFIGSYIAFYLVMSDWLRKPERRRRIVRVLFCSTLFVSLFGLVQRLAGNYTPVWHFLYGGQEAALNGAEELGRIPSFLGHPGHLAVYLDLILPFAIACYVLSNERRWKRLSALTAILGIVALALSQSRGGLLGFVAITVYAILHFGKTRWRKALLILAFSGMAAGAYVLLRQWNPLHFSEYSSDNAVLGRLYLWSTAWDFFLSSPLHGVGIGTLAVLFEPYLPNIPSIDPRIQLEAHNIYFELLAEAGILGFLSFFGVVIAAYREAQRQLRSLDWFQHAFAFGVAAGIIGALVGGFFDHSLLWAPQVGFLLWLGIGGVVASAYNTCLPRETERVN